MVVIVALLLLFFGVMLRKETQSREWLVVANTAIMAGVAFLFYFAAVIVLIV